MTGFPNLITTPEAKDDKYYLQVAKAVNDEYGSGNGYVNASRADEFRLNRLYGQGKQPMEMYSNWMTVKLEGSDANRTGLNQINYDIAPIAPKIRNQVIEMLLKKSGGLNVIFQDEMSTVERKKEKAALFMEGQMGEQLNQISQKMGIERPSKPFVPKNMKDLNLYEDIGGIKIMEEVALESALNNLFESDMEWSKYNAPELIGWLFDNGIAGEVLSVNPNTLKVEARVINWENAIIEHSSRWDYKDAKYFGEYIGMSFMDIHNSVFEATGRKIPRKECEQMMSVNKGSNSSTFNYMDYYSIDEGYYDSPFNNSAMFTKFNVRVLDFMFLCTDVIKTKETTKVQIKSPRKNEVSSGKVKTDGRGNYYKEVKADSVPVHVRRWRRGKWVVNTDLVFDCGVVFDQVYDDKAPMQPFRVVRLQVKSPIQLMRPHLDEIQKDWLQIQNLKASAFGNILSIDVDRMFNAIVGGKSLDKKGLASIIRLSNLHVYSGSAIGSSRMGTQGKPIEILNGGMGNLFKELMEDIMYQRNMIYENTGLNPVALGSAPESGETLGQTEISVSAAANALGSLYRAHKSIKESSAYSLLLLLQYVVKQYPETPYRYLIGEGNYKVIKGIRTDLRKMSVSVREMMNSIEMQEINRMIEIALAGGKNGNAGITIYQAALLKSMIQEGKPFKQIALMMKYYQDAEQEKQQAMQENMMRVQSEEVMKQQQAGMQAESQMKQFDAQVKSGLQEQKANLDLRNDLAVINSEKRNDTKKGLQT